MKKILVTFKVKDVAWWLENNTLVEEWYQIGAEVELFRKRDSNQIGFIAKISNANLFDELIQNSIFLSSSLKSNGVMMETLEIHELVQ